MAISYDDFAKVDVRVGTIVAAEPYPEARKPTYKLQVDFGPEIGVKKSSAQCTVHYRLEELVGRQVSAVVNFPPKQIGKFMSEVSRRRGRSRISGAGQAGAERRQAVLSKRDALRS